MAVTKRNYPNDYYCWFNDDDRVAILERVTTTDSSQTHKESWDTFQSSGDLSGTITDADCSGTTITFTTDASHGLATNDRVSIAGTTSFNDDNLSNQTITVTGVTTFTMTRSSSSSNTNETGTWKSLFVDNGLRITFHSKYEELTAISDDLKTSAGLDSGMHHALVYYVRFRLLQDMGDVQQAEYYRKLFQEIFSKYPSRKSGVRFLSVPRL